MRAIHSFTKILSEEYGKKLDEEGNRICGIIKSNTIQMGELIDDLLNFSRLGKSLMHESLIDMNSLVRSVFKSQTETDGKSRVKVKIDHLEDCPGDQALLEMVWNNLISNAIKYSSRNSSPEISIWSSATKKSVTYFISDNGVGFDMVYKDKLFGVFQRLHTTKEFEGNGVGLAIVKRIINRHGGEVYAEAETHKGATFSFSIPLK